jgi:molybdate transport system substrate-binding protein
MKWRNCGAVAALVALAATLAACGGSSAPGSSSAAATSAAVASGAPAGGGTLRVFAASSLKEAFPKLAAAFSAANPGAKVEFSFAGSDELATQIQEGAQADVYAAASTKYPDTLAAAGEVDKPVPFTTNTLVLATPSGSTAVTDLASLAQPGIKLVIGAAGVPVGDYTRKVLPALDASQGAGWSAAVMKNVVSEEQNVKGIVAKLQSGDADAGFVYVTDAKAAAGALTQIPIPADASPTATYPIAVVSKSDAKELARRWIDFVLSAAGQTILKDAGFGEAPTA